MIFRATNFRATGTRSCALALAAMLACAAGAALAETPKASAADKFARSASDEKARQSADEQEMLEKARREAAAQREGAGRLTVNIGAPPAAEKEALEKKRQDELASLSEKLRRASVGRVARPPTLVETPWSTDVTVAPKDVIAPEQRSALGHKPTAATANDGRVTVLMVMAPGNKGIRRFDKSADPILCARDGCYVSSGPDSAARFHALGRSTGLGGIFGQRAGACNQRTTCVFRGVDLSGTDAILQPVDLKVMVHDRRSVSSASPDTTCRVDMGRLMCGRPIVAGDYTLWVVPEHVAELAGAAFLQHALTDGLPNLETRADLPWLKN